MADRYEEVIRLIKENNRFLVLSHVNPEGDAVGSLLGLALALRDMGKDVTAYLEDPVPEIFRFLPGADTVVHDLGDQEPFQVTFAVDCGQKERLGAGFSGFKEPGLIVNIDHHATNDRFGDVNVIEPGASATGEMIFDLLKAMGAHITPEVATNLYVAIHTDTGSFRYSSSTADAFIKTGELVRLGADPWEVTTRVYESYPVEKLRLLGLSLSTLEVMNLNGAGVALMRVTLDMFRKTGGAKEHTDGFVNFARSIKGVEVAVLFREDGPDRYKVSLRSKGNVDVSLIASAFGGGGHHNAAGFNMEGGFEEIKKRVLDVISEKLLSVGRV